MGSRRWNLPNAVHHQHAGVGLAAELVSTVTRTNRHGQRVHARRGHELLGLVRIGEQLLSVDGPLGAVPVFLVAHAGLQASEHAQLAFDRYSLGMGHRHDLTRHGNVVVV